MLLIYVHVIILIMHVHGLIINVNLYYVIHLIMNNYVMILNVVIGVNKIKYVEKCVFKILDKINVKH